MARLVPTAFTHLVPGTARTWSGNRDGRCMPWISATGAATDGPDEPGQDGWTPFATTLIGLTIAEMCECRSSSGPSIAARAGGDAPDEPGHDGGATACAAKICSSRRLILIAGTHPIGA